MKEKLKKQIRELDRKLCEISKYGFAEYDYQNDIGSEVYYSDGFSHTHGFYRRIEPKKYEKLIRLDQKRKELRIKLKTLCLQKKIK